jgi:cell division initiation protein
MGITPNEILEKEFKVRFRGFDPSEVQEFLEDVASELTGVIKEKNTLKGYVAGYKTKLDEFKKREEEFMSALTTANRLAEDMKAQAARESEAILERARMDAERIVADAHKEAMRLEERIRGLRRMQREAVFKIRSSIEGYLRLLDEEALPPQEVDDVLRDAASDVLAVQSQGDDASEGKGPRELVSGKEPGVLVSGPVSDDTGTGVRLVDSDITGDGNSNVLS